MCGFDEARRLRVVAESLANLTNGDFQDGVADEGFGPDRVEQVIFGDELARTPDEMVEHGEGFGPQLDRLGPSPQLLVDQIEAKGVEENAFFVPHCSHPNVTEILRQAYDLAHKLGLLSIIDGGMAILD